MKKTLLYLVLLALLGGGVWFFLFREKKSVLGAPKTVDGVYEDAFQIKDTGDIGRIFLAQKGGGTSTLSRTEEGGWRIDDKHPAFQAQVNALLTTLAQQAPSAAVPEFMRDPVVRLLAGEGIKVELYNRKGKKFRTFYVGGEAPNFTGSYMLMEHGERAYVVQKPFFTGFLTPYYTPGMTVWRDRRVLFAPQADITKIEVRYADSVENSFILRQDASGTPSIESGVTNGQLVKGNAKYYLASFEKLYVLNYINGNPGIDTIIGQMPLHCMLKLDTKDGRSQEMTVYYYPLTRRSKNMDAPEGHHGINNNYDGENYYAILNNKQDTAVIQLQMFGKILKHAADFYSYEAGK